MCMNNLESINFTTIEVSLNKGIAIIKINNPPVNSLNGKVMDEIEIAFDNIKENEDVRVVVIGSSHEKLFIAGYDINEFISWDRGLSIKECTKGHRILSKIESLSKPVICAINGSAFGGGLEMALACDIRIIDPRAKVGLPETGLGIIPGYGGTIRLPKIVGKGMAKKLIFSAEPKNAQEAFRIGLVEMITEEGECLNQALKLAITIASRAPKAITAAKKAIDYGMIRDYEKARDFELFQLGELCETSDKTEGINAFLNKKIPNFNNK